MAAPCTARAIAIFALAAGCGGSWSASFPMGVTADSKLSVSAYKGTVRLRESRSGQIEVVVRGKAPVPLDQAVAFTIVAEPDGPGRHLAVVPAAMDAELDLEVAAPAGIRLYCSCSAADVQVSGAWSLLRVVTAGTIDARVDATAGSLRSQRGDVRLDARGAGPTGELRAESTSGNVSVTLPARWTGQLKFRTQTGKLDVPTHKGLQTIWDENLKGVVGRLGGRREEDGPLPTVWGVSGTGNVLFRVGE